MSDANATPTVPSPSATLILARKAGATIQVYLLRRSPASRFLPGAYVFPGGSVERGDREVTFWRQHLDTAGERLQSILAGPADRMLPFAVAAIRETWEEAGLLLTTPPPRAADAALLRAQQVPFPSVVRRLGLKLATSRLVRWRRWITPQRSPRRFDTYFFLAMVPNQQTCRPDGRETVDGRWINPLRALAANADGTLPLSPPTLVTLHQMRKAIVPADLIHASRQRDWPAPIRPRWWPLERGFLILMPWDPEYGRKAVAPVQDPLTAGVLPVGAPFSRLWCHQGVCLPVSAIRGPLGR